MRYVFLLPILLGACTSPSTSVRVNPALATQPVHDVQGDPAIWINRAAPARSLIFGINEGEAPSGALLVYDLGGQHKQTIAGLDRPSSVDVEYNMSVGGRPSDIAVVTESRRSRLRVLRVWPDGSGVEENSEIPVFEGQQGDFAGPTGLALYRRPADGAVFAIVSRKNGPRHGYLWQYRLATDFKGRVTAEKVREFGDFSGKTEIAAIAVDDEAGFVYYADAQDSIRIWHADPDHPDAAREVTRFGLDGFRGSRQDLAIYPLPGGEGYVICTDQLPGSSEYRIYDRKTPSKLLKVLSGGADSTNGIDATSAALGPQFPRGLLVAGNSGPRTLLAYRWTDIASTGEPKLK